MSGATGGWEGSKNDATGFARIADARYCIVVLAKRVDLLRL